MSNNKKTPLVSIIIVTYNGFHILKNCLVSILKNNYSNYEIIVIDNGSSDQSISKIHKKFKDTLNKIKTISLEKNYGPAIARNKAVAISKGKYIAFLDNDTIVDPNWIVSAIKLFKKNKKIGIIQSKILLLDQKNKFDYAGELLGQQGFLKPIAKYMETDKRQYNKNYKILSAKSAAMFIRRQAFLDVDGFDQDYFIFIEESDLGWRAWLKGYENLFCPQSIVYHKFSSTRTIVNKNFYNYLIRFHGTKNYIQTLIKNLNTINLITILPVHLFLWLSLALYLILNGNINSGHNILKGLWWNIAHINSTFKKRVKIQKERMVSDKFLFIDQHLMTNTNIYYYIKKYFDSLKQIPNTEN